MKTCKNCGAQYSDEALSCPNCNSVEVVEQASYQQAPYQQAPNYAPYQQTQPTTEKKKMNVFGLVGMIIGIVSCFIGGYVGIVISIVGLVFSAIGMKNMKNCRLNGFAITGLVLGIVALVYCILFVAVLEAFLLSLA